MKGKNDAKFNPWGLGVMGANVLAIYVFVLATLTPHEQPMWIRNCVWALVPVGGILSAISLIKAEQPKGVWMSVLFALHLANLALAVVMVVVLLVALPGIMRGTAR
jgi:hypothetical protein